MCISQFKQTLIAVALSSAVLAHAAVTPEEARQLGTTLTMFGSEKAGSKDGIIPEYTGGVTAPPSDYVKGSAMRPDPYASDKPRLVITAKNMAAYEDQLSAGTRELLKRFPSFRVDVYPTRRSVNYPKYINDNTAKNALAAKTTDGGVGLDAALAGVPFPIPKTGNEVMWNHLLRYQGTGMFIRYDSWNVDSSGRPTLATTG